MAEPARTGEPAIRALRQELAQASDPQVMRIVATVDALMARGAADDLIAPLRQRLVELRPPRPLRFARLLFHPLDPLIVPAPKWRPDHLTIPRTAVTPIAAHVLRSMAQAGAAIDAGGSGHTDAETDLIARLGQSLWPAAALILAEPDVPDSWSVTELGDTAYRQLAGTISALLAQAPTMDAMCAATANGLLPPRAEAIGEILGRVRAANGNALPMMITLLLTRLPQAAAVLAALQTGLDAPAVQAASDQATGLLLQRLEAAGGVETRIATGSLADSAGAVKDIAALLGSLEKANAPSSRRAQLHAVRDRLDTGCRQRFASELQDDLLLPLGRLASLPDAAQMSALETVARGLRVLETEARKIGGGATYDLLLGKAAAAVESPAVQERLSAADQARLVEILAGSDAALALLGPGSR